ERQRRVRCSESLHSRLRSKGKRNNLPSGNKVAWPVELFRTCPGNRKNGSTDRSSPAADGGEFALIIPVKIAINKLSISAILFGIIGIGAGLFLGFGLG